MDAWNADLNNSVMSATMSEVATSSEPILSLEADGVHLFDLRYQIPFVPTPRKLEINFVVK